MKRHLIIAFVSLASIVISLSVDSRHSVTAKATSSDDRLQGSYRFERNGWIYIHLEGSPERIGYQHGYLLSAEIADLLRVEKPFLLKTTKRDWDFYRRAAEQMLWPKTEPEYQREIDGIVAGMTARGVKADRWDLVAINALCELPGYYVPWLDKQEGRPASSHAPDRCSAFVATGSYTKDRKIVMGHNNWSDYVVGSRWNIIFDIKPENGHRILMDGLAGLIVSGDDFTINSNGIMITETTIGGFEGFDPKGKPEFSRARKAMQYSSSIDDFVRIMLDGNNGGYANDWLIGDNKTGEIALFELGLKNHSVRRTKDGYFIGSNFPVDAKLAREETTFDLQNSGLSANARRVRWEQLMAEHKGKIDVELGKKFESDGYDVIDKSGGPNERSLCGCNERSVRGMSADWGKYFPAGTVQSKVTDSAMARRMQLWAAMGRQCATSFKADMFLIQHPEYEWMRGLLRDLNTEPWTRFAIGMK